MFRTQVGAIILIDDRVVGIERAPSHAYWQSIWPSLIRECYGSLAIEAAKTSGDRSPDRSPRVQLPLQIATLDELESLIAEIASQEDERARSTVRELLDEPLDSGPRRDRGRRDDRHRNVGSLHRSSDPRRRHDRLRITSRNQVVREDASVDASGTVCDLSRASFA